MNSTNTIIKNTNKTNRVADFENVIQKCKAKGLDVVLDFLQSKARKSPQTAIAFYAGLNYLNMYITEEYNKYNSNKDKDKDKGYDIQTIIPAIKQNQVDVYTLLNSFVTFLQ